MSKPMQVKERKLKSKGHLNELRNTGFVPSIVYGRDFEDKAITVNELEFMRYIRRDGRNALIQLELENGEKIDTMIQALQVDPIDNRIIHADFQIIRQDEEINTSAPIRLVGTAKGVEDGGILEQQLEEIQIRCLPRHIPDAIEVDILDLGVDDILRVDALKLPEGVEVLNNEDEIIARISLPRIAEETEEAEVAEVTEASAGEDAEDSTE